MTIYSFGIVLAIGFFAASFLIWKQARRNGYSEEKVLDVLFLSTFLSIVDSRTVYVISNWAVFSADYSRIFYFFKYPGLSVPTLILTAIFSVALLARYFGLEILGVLDIFGLAAVFFTIFVPKGVEVTVVYTAVSLVLLLLAKLFSVEVNLASMTKKKGFFFLCYLIFQLVFLLIAGRGRHDVTREVFYGLGIVVTAGIVLVRYQELFKYFIYAVSKRRARAN